jgi:hypothetical protein
MERMSKTMKELSKDGSVSRVVFESSIYRSRVLESYRYANLLGDNSKGVTMWKCFHKDIDNVERAKKGELKWNGVVKRAETHKLIMSLTSVRSAAVCR